MLFNAAWAQQGGGRHLYQHPIPPNDQYTGYQWRPVEAQNSSLTEEVQTFRGGAEILPSLSQPINTVPAGAYRPIAEDRLSPQVGSYRFRAISADEKLRIQRLEQGRNRQVTEAPQKLSTSEATEPAPVYWPPAANAQPVFRPDDRFSNNPVQNFPVRPSDTLQSYPPSYLSPLFRPKDRY